MVSNDKIYQESKKQFSFLESDFGFQLMTDKNENMFVLLKYVREKTTIQINWDRRDNYLAIEAENLRTPDKEFIHRFEDINHFPQEIIRSAKKVKTMCLSFLK